MKSLAQSNSENYSKSLINKQNNIKSRANLNQDFNSLFSINNSNMDSIDKQIKSKYTSAIDYLNNLNKKSTNSENQKSFNNDNIIQLKKEFLSLFDSKINTDKNKKIKINFMNENLKNNNLEVRKIYMNKKFYNNSSSKSKNKEKENLKKKINKILFYSQKKNENEKKINKSMMNLSNTIYNEKTKEKMKEIYEILRPRKDTKKKALHYEIFDESLAAFKLRELRDKKLYPSLRNFINGNEEKIINNNSSRFIKKINPHVDLYDEHDNIENIQKSASCQRIIHMTKVLDFEVKKNNHYQLNFENFSKKNNDENFKENKKDLFADTHERKIKNKLIDFSKFTIFPDFMKRKKDDGLLKEYANNNLQIISNIKSDWKNKNTLKKNEEKNNNNGKRISIKNNDNLKKNNEKKFEEKKENKIDIKEDINIDDLLN